MVEKFNPHYYKSYPIQVADAITSWRLDFCEGNIVKYVVRHKEKNGKEDLLKAVWYLNKLLGVEYGTNIQEHIEVLEDDQINSSNRRSNGSDEETQSMDHKTSL